MKKPHVWVIEVCINGKWGACILAHSKRAALSKIAKMSSKQYRVAKYVKES